MEQRQAGGAAVAGSWACCSSSSYSLAAQWLLGAALAAVAQQPDVELLMGMQATGKPGSGCQHWCLLRGSSPVSLLLAGPCAPNCWLRVEAMWGFQ
jgi:hypothetical protein